MKSKEGEERVMYRLFAHMNAGQAAWAFCLPARCLQIPANGTYAAFSPMVEKNTRSP